MLNRLRDIRRYKQMSQEELATKAGVSKNTISKIENSRTKYIRSDVLKKLSLALDVAPDKIAGDIIQVFNPCTDHLTGCLLVLDLIRENKLLFCENDNPEKVLSQYEGYYYAYGQVEFYLFQLIKSIRKQKKK